MGDRGGSDGRGEAGWQRSGVRGREKEGGRGRKLKTTESGIKIEGNIETLYVLTGQFLHVSLQPFFSPSLPHHGLMRLSLEDIN